MRWIAAHTWLLLLVPLIGGIILCYYTAFPINLFADTDADYLDKDTVLQVLITNEGQDRAKTIRYVAQTTDGSRFLLYLQKDSLPQPHIGDQLLVQTTVRRGGMLGHFDYGRYLQMQHIVGSGWAHRGNWLIIGHQDIKGIRATAERCQQWLYKRYQVLGIHQPELGIIAALTLGYREELNKQVQQSFSAAGAMHILAVSGLHTGILWTIILGILTLGGLAKPLYHNYWQRWTLALLSILLLWGYAFITGLSPSVMRSALMLSLIEIGYLLKRPINGLNCLAAAAVIILIINPLALWSVSFQLSFAAMAALILVAQRIQQRVILRGNILAYIGGLLITSLAAQIGTAPLTLYYFGQTSNYFALTNLIVIPLAFVLLSMSLCAIALSWSIIGTWIASGVQWSTWGLRQYVEWIENLPFSTTNASITAPSVILLYAIIFSAMMMMRGNKVHWGWMAGVILCMAIVVCLETNIIPCK